MEGPANPQMTSAAPVVPQGVPQAPTDQLLFDRVMGRAARLLTLIIAVLVAYIAIRISGMDMGAR